MHDGNNDNAIHNDSNDFDQSQDRIPVQRQTATTVNDDFKNLSRKFIFEIKIYPTVSYVTWWPIGYMG